nr:immunoglobulin light chain junction region [Macaca mulatta]MOW72829.1 immunoglobulin light chain junction region [Macaca mulatta]MOW72877.1 immunoglobulin light chain junction region [Macaca mulatta]MOW72881.1 immunoglobulin light chain junction region [Macaca mulatta]MOW72958.1 immunoglobulin light chain junction region [Macaca mulatta]
CQQHYTYPYSF